MDGSDELAGIVAAALEAHADAAERVRAGNAKAIGPIVGYVMRETRGRADGGETGLRAQAACPADADSAFAPESSTRVGELSTLGLNRHSPSRQQTI